PRRALRRPAARRGPGRRRARPAARARRPWRRHHRGREPALQRLQPRAAHTAVVATCPSTASPPVLSRVWALRGRVRRAVLMLQREVAERLVAPAGGDARGMPSVVVQAWATVRRA